MSIEQTTDRPEQLMTPGEQRITLEGDSRMTGWIPVRFGSRPGGTVAKFKVESGEVLMELGDQAAYPVMAGETKVLPSETELRLSTDSAADCVLWYETENRDNQAA